MEAKVHGSAVGMNDNGMYCDRATRDWLEIRVVPVVHHRGRRRGGLSEVVGLPVGTTQRLGVVPTSVIPDVHLRLSPIVSPSNGLYLAISVLRTREGENEGHQLIAASTVQLLGVSYERLSPILEPAVGTLVVPL